MTHRRWFCLAVATLAGSPALPITARGQSASISAVSIRTDHTLLGDRLLGGAARVSTRFSSGRWSAQVGTELLTGTVRRIGVPCGGFIPPDCLPEPLRDDSRLISVSAGLGLRAFAWRRFVVDIGGDVRVGGVRVVTRGLTSGKELPATEALWGLDVGADATWLPWARLPIALELGIGGSAMIPFVGEEVMDGYTPFSDGFSGTRARVGVAWKPGSR